MYGVDDSSESEYGRQSASAASEEDLDFCIMKNCGSFLTNDKFENFDEFLLDHRTENSEEVLMAGKIENSEKIAMAEPTWAKLDEVKNSQSNARDLTEFENLVAWMKVRTKSPNLGWRHRQWQHQQGQQNQARVAATKHNFEATSVLEYAHDESDPLMTPTEAHGSRMRLWLTVGQSNA